uniref:Uncharacterized protein n=1 Tax=Oryza glumipatula TaxID=40148 RepID=A0A0E0ABC6_9ORYZ
MAQIIAQPYPEEGASAQAQIDPSRAEPRKSASPARAAADGRRATTAAPRRARAQHTRRSQAIPSPRLASAAARARGPVLISCGDQLFGSLADARAAARHGGWCGVVWLAGDRGRPIPGHPAGDTARSTWRGAIRRWIRVTRIVTSLYTGFLSI